MKSNDNDIIKIKQENYKLKQHCHSQQKSIKSLTQRLTELKSENEKLKTEKDLQDEVLKKLKAKFLYVPASEVLSKQIIELKNKVDSYKSKYNQINRKYMKISKQNKSFKQQLANTNTALHNILSNKYVILNSKTQNSESETPPNTVDDSNSSSPCETPVTKAMQQDIEKLEQLIQNLDYDKGPDFETLQRENAKEPETDPEKEKEILDMEKIIFEHGSLQNDNRDLALEIAFQEETNAKLSQSVNDLWLFSNQLLLKLEKQQTWKNYANRKMVYINEQLVTFKKMFHRTRFYFSQLSMDYMKQLHELKRIINEILHQNNEYKEELKDNGLLKIKIIELKKVLEKYEIERNSLQNEKQILLEKYEMDIGNATAKAIKTKNERDALLHKLDSLMTKHSL